MKKLINKIDIYKFLIIFLLFQPLVDLFTSLFVRYNINSLLSPGIIIKGLFLLFLLIYNLMKYRFSNRKFSTIFTIITIFYEIVFLFICYKIKGFLVLPNEIKSSFKTLFFPLILVNLYDIFKNENIKIKSRYMVYILLEYSFLIFVAKITGTSFNSYSGVKEGSIGWFYAANDIGNILIALFPILYFYCVKNYKILFILLSVMVIYVLTTIGTKVTSLGVILVFVSILILFILNFYFYKNKIKLKKNIFLFLLFVFTFLFFLNFSPAISNLKIQYNNLKEQTEKSKESKKTKNKSNLTEMVYSGRSEFLKASTKRYLSSSISQKIFGTGYYNSKNEVYKLVERDHYDVLFSNGILGLIIVFLPMFIILIKLLNILFKNNLKKMFKMNIEIYAISLLIFIGVSFYSGHVLLNPSVSIYLILVILMLYFKVININYCKKVKNNKITFLALHLKPGGIETFIASTAGFLSKKYDVEIVSVYKYSKKEEVKIDSNVKIKYLLDSKYVPNKNKIKSLIISKKYLHVIPEVVKSLNILLMKNVKMINYVKKCNSDIIISTREEHNYILSEYSNDDVLKIVTEHNYYSKSYSTRILNSCSDIDYFIVSTQDQASYYSKLFNGTYVKVLIIPFGIETISSSSKLDNYNLISIGRLSKEKGFLDLIDIFNLLHKKNNKYTLTIIGYGEEEKNIKNKIKSLSLEKYVKLVGKKNHDEVIEYLLNSSMYLMTSYTESFGIVLIEAMECGVPSILFDDAKGALEVIKDDYNGYIISNRNINEYVNKIDSIFNNNNKLKQLGANCKKEVEKYDISNIEKKWEKVIGEINES